MMLIDKYLLRSFIVPFLYCIGAFTLIFIALDLFQNLRELVQGDTPATSIIAYYLFLLPVNIVYIVPVSLLLAVLQSLSSLTKNNELTAMRASGLSMIRLMMPYMLAGLVASVGVFIMNETITPKVAYWCQMFSKAQKGKPDVNVHTIALKNTAANRIWYIQEFDAANLTMRKVQITQRLEGDDGEYKVQAAEGRWLDGYLVFNDVSIQQYDADGNPMGPARFYRTSEMMEFNEKTSDFLTEIKPPEFMSSAELIHYLDLKKNLPREARISREVDLHFRLAQPWNCLVVTLLGIPFGNQTGRKGALRGFALSLGLFFGYYTLVNIGVYAGKEGVLPPVLAGWLPNLLFLISGAYMVYRMR